MSSELQEGTIFAGRYKIMRRLAQGGMGAVYEVVHLETDRRRALKVMHPHTLHSEDMRERFKLEARVAAHIESDFIVDVFDAGVDEATQMPFLVMELLRGEELGKRLKRLGRLPPEEVVLHLHQTALALDKTHKASIVHRDLKPENLFLAEREDSQPRIKVLDFGIAKIVAESATNGGPTQSIGTPLYMSPEQFNPTTKLSGASDIYALGMISYTLIVGVPYWSEEARGGNIFAMAAVAIHGPPQPATVRAAARGVALPPAFDTWFKRATAVNPDHRYPTASLAVRELAEIFNVPLPLAGGSLSERGNLIGWSSGPEAAPMPVAHPLPDSPPIVPSAATSLGISMTRPIHRSKGNGRFVAGVLALSAIALGSGLVLAVRWRHANSVAPTGEPQLASPTPSADIPLPPPSMSAPEQATPAARRAPEPGLSASVGVAPKPASAPSLSPVPSSSAQPAPAHAPTASTKPAKKYTPD